MFIRQLMDMIAGRLKIVIEYWLNIILSQSTPSWAQSAMVLSLFRSIRPTPPSSVGSTTQAAMACPTTLQPLVLSHDVLRGSRNVSITSMADEDVETPFRPRVSPEGMCGVNGFWFEKNEESPSVKTPNGLRPASRYPSHQF